MIIYSILSSIFEEREDIIEASHYSLWIMFTRSSLADNNYPRAIIYINIKFIKLCFSLRKDIQIINRLS